MLKTKNQAASPTVDALGELHPLMAQLGSADGLVTLSGAAAALRLPAIETPGQLRLFLRSYSRCVLLPRELPWISRAFQLASQNQVRELVALDQAIGRDTEVPALTDASRRVGRSQLERLRPLRTERVVQRYLEAVQAGRAHGWHTLVFGLTLAVYSLPVRQGLMTYARQTLRGFIQGAARVLHLKPGECRDLLDQLCAPLPQRLEEIVAADIRSSPPIQKGC